MREPAQKRVQGPLVPATAASKGLDFLPVGSAASRAAARSLANARQASEADQRRYEATTRPLPGSTEEVSGVIAMFSQDLY
jgi:hypothetical protein